MATKPNKGKNMCKLQNFLFGILLATALPVSAAVSVTPTVTTDYDFRGISDSATKPALQVGIDYNKGPAHLGAWASTIDWGRAYKGKTEVDWLADYTFGSDETAKVNVAAAGYTYPGMTEQNTAEFSATVTKSVYSAGVHYSADWFGAGKAWYYETNVSVPVAETGITIGGHVGRSVGEAWRHIEYTDYAVSVSKTFSHMTGTIKVVNSNAQNNSNVFAAGTRAVLAVSTTLPWGS